MNFELFCRQYQDFLEDLEEDETLRKNVNIFKGEGFSAWNCASIRLLCVLITPLWVFRLLQDSCGERHR